MIACSSAAATSTTCSLFRNAELDLLFEAPEVVEPTERQVFDELVAMSVPATVPTGFRETRLECGDGPDLAIPVSPGRSR